MRLERRVLVSALMSPFLACSLIAGCGSTGYEADDESGASLEVGPETDLEYDAGADIADKAITADASVRTVVHILRNFSLTTGSGVVMSNDHVSVSNLGSALSNANSLWKRPELQSVVMNATVVEESALRPTNVQALKNAIMGTTRDNPGASFDAYWKLLDPSKRSVPNALHIYIVPFYGQTLQGVTRLGSRAIIMGSWSNKDGGGAPTKRNIAELPRDSCAQSFVRTIAHEFGHALTLQHSDCTSCIMQGCTDVGPVRSKALRGWSQYWR